MNSLNNIISSWYVAPSIFRLMYELLSIAIEAQQKKMGGTRCQLTTTSLFYCHTPQSIIPLPTIILPNMKTAAFFALLASSAAAFAPAQVGHTSTALNAETDGRRAFLGAAAAGVFAAIPAVANAGTMAQENVKDPTEVWETGLPSADAKAARAARYTNARTQMTSSFPPQKRLTLERKSPVTRLDINSPGFEAYKRTYPGLYKKAPGTEAPAAAAAPADAEAA